MDSKGENGWRDLVVADFMKKMNLSRREATLVVEQDLAKVPERNRIEWLRRWANAPEVMSDTHETAEFVAFVMKLNELYYE